MEKTFYLDVSTITENCLSTKTDTDMFSKAIFLYESLKTEHEWMLYDIF